MSISTSNGWIAFVSSVFFAVNVGVLPVLAQIAPTQEAIAATRSSQTTWLILRHAEREGDADRLSPAGLERANDLKQLGEILNVDVIYSTDTERTRDTVELLAKARGIEVKIYSETSTAWFDKTRLENAGRVVMIVGHSNTAGVIAGLLANTPPFQIAHDEYDSMFVVTTDSTPLDSPPSDPSARTNGSGATTISSVVRLKYGRSSAKAQATKSEQVAPTR